MEKILKSYTIIPPHLYVNRGADRQLRGIVEDMGRPGYVLVSRQMGKTNLLLNAKRELSNENDKFIYIDLSNTFSDETACFQNIINTALETNEDVYSNAARMIFDNRKKKLDIPPHKQHENELRILLKSTNGKLVIILDEIDALTKTSFSDKIFAQIRSIYFSRVNFSELERLTYILSGVVEPSEIIKDPKISPFNIGEKIFLNDFSKEEFEKFIEKAKLDSLQEELIERIYYWTNGNPRMTWDLCSEIENNKELVTSKEQIDDIVQRLYLTSFDKPPIDNIREMVISDKSIRDAIVEIDYNKGKEVADNIKSKLYLAGIINYEENDIKIKNRIIRNSLSRSWLESVKEQEQGLIKIALELFEKEKYSEAIEVYERFMQNNEFPDVDSEGISYFHFGLALYNVSNFERAIEILEKTKLSIKTYPKIVCRIKKIIGICYLALNKPEDSLKYFEYVIDNNLKDEIYVSSLLNYGVAYSKLDGQENKDRAIEAYKKIVEEVHFEENLSELEIDEFKSLACYYIGLIHKSLENNEEAISYYKKALKTKKQELKPTFYFNLIIVSKDIQVKKQCLSELISCIVENQIIPTEKNPERPLELSNELLYSIQILAFQLEIKEFEKLLDYTLELVYKNTTFEQIIHTLATLNFQDDVWETAVDLLKYLFVKATDKVNSVYYYSGLKLLAYFNKYNINPEYSNEYIKLFSKSRQEPVDTYDFDIFSHTVYYLIVEKEYDTAKEYLNKFFSIKSEINEDLLVNVIVLKHFNFQIQQLTGNINEAKSIANEILEEIEKKKYKNTKSDLLGSKGLEDIRIAAYSFLHPLPNRIPIKVEKKYSRNDYVKVRYDDGRVVEKKYKAVEKDIEKKICKIVAN